MTLQFGIDTTLENIIKKAVDFHGHLGPFLVIGVRMGFIGLRELELKEGAEKLHATALLKYSVPFSCVLDGLQATTGCTFGNQKLTLKNSPGITVEFQLPNKKKVTVVVNQTTFDKLKKKLLSEKASNHEIQELAQLMASMPEEDLFVIIKE